MPVCLECVSEMIERKSFEVGITYQGLVRALTSTSSSLCTFLLHNRSWFSHIQDDRIVSRLIQYNTFHDSGPQFTLFLSKEFLELFRWNVVGSVSLIKI